MKKIIWVFAVLLFGLGVLLISIDRLTNCARPSLAAPSLSFNVGQTTPTLSPTPKVEYYLVYPGILPDQPLYKLKMVRDRIWVWLTTDPVKKAELYLLYADKRLGAGKILIEGNKVSIGISTLWKGEKYLEKVAGEIVKAKARNLSAGLVSQKAKTAVLKHQEVLRELKEKISAERKTDLEEILKYSDEVRKKLDTI